MPARCPSTHHVQVSVGSIQITNNYADSSNMTLRKSSSCAWNIPTSRIYRYGLGGAESVLRAVNAEPGETIDVLQRITKTKIVTWSKRPHARYHPRLMSHAQVSANTGGKLGR